MIDIELLDEIKEYCDINDLHLETTLNKALRGGFTTVKFGATPMSSKKENKPVEVIKTVEKVVEKIVKVSDDTKVNELLKDVEYLKGETDAMANILLIRDKTIEELTKKLKECEENNKKDIYGE